jgi:hypothetical protein
MLTAAFSFEQYRALRAGLQDADLKMEKFVQTNRDPLLSKYLRAPAGSSGDFDLEAWYHAVVKTLSENQDLVALIRTAAQEPHPLRKLERLNQAMVAVKEVAQADLAAYKLLTPEETKPIFIAFIIATNPPYLVSNRVYLADFCSISELASVIQGFVASPLDLLGEVVANCPEIDAARFIRYKQRRQTLSHHRSHG